MKKFQRVGVLMGGISAEREVSLESGTYVHDALRKRGYDCVGLSMDHNVDTTLRQASVEVIFNALHGRYGEDGCIQGLLEIMAIPYTGSNVLASALAMNKIKAKEIFRLHNLPTPPYYVLGREDFVHLESTHGAFGFPVVVKPPNEGSSVGVAMVKNFDELERACEAAFTFDNWVLVERYIRGVEVHVGIVGEKPLGGVEILPSSEIFDYESKYTPGKATYFLPPRIPSERYEGILTQALWAHKALGCSGATRVNMIVSELGNEYILEVNTVPGLTRQSLLPKIAVHAGLSFEDLVEAILEDACLRTAGYQVKNNSHLQGINPKSILIQSHH